MGLMLHHSPKCLFHGLLIYWKEEKMYSRWSKPSKSCPAALNDESRLIIPWKQCFPLMYWTVAACQGLFCHIELKMFLQCIAVHSSVSVPAGSRGGVDWWSERRGDKRCFSLTNGAKHVRYLLCTVVFWVHYEALDTQEYSATHLVCFYGRPRSIK